jgi:hypothetical protein
MFATPEKNKANMQVNEDMLLLIETDELESVENEIIEEIKKYEALKKRDDNEFYFQNDFQWKREQVEFTNWLAQEMPKIVRFKLFTFYTACTPGYQVVLAKAKNALVKHYGEEVFQVSEDTEVEAEAVGRALFFYVALRVIGLLGLGLLWAGVNE